MSAPEARYPLQAENLSSSLKSQKRWVMVVSESTTISFSSMGLRLHLPRIFAEFYSSLSWAATPSQPDLAGNENTNSALELSAEGLIDVLRDPARKSRALLHSCPTEPLEP